MGRRFIGLEFDWMGMPMHGPGHSCRGHFCFFSLYLTPLTLLHGTGASETFRFKKQGQTCKVKKNRGKRAVTAQNKGSYAIDMLRAFLSF